MSVAGLMVMMVQVALALAAFRVDGYLGVGATLCQLAAGCRLAIVTSQRREAGRPLSWLGWLGLLLTSTGVAGLILGSALVGLLGPSTAVTMVFEGLGLEDFGGKGPYSWAISTAMVLTLLAALGGGLILGFNALLVTAAWLGPVAPNWREGLWRVGRVGLVGVALAVLALAVQGPVEDAQHRRRIGRVAGFVEAARAQATKRRACLARVERGESHCDHCRMTDGATLRLEAERAERQVAGEEAWMVELTRQGDATRSARWVRPWAMLPALAYLGVLLPSAVRASYRFWAMAGHHDRDSTPPEG